MATTFHHLVDRCLLGDELAMIELVEQFRARVYGLCYRMLGQRQDAEDAVQETFVRVLKNLSRWDPTREFEPWLFAIAGNRCRTMLAKRKRRPTPQPLVEVVPDNSADPHAFGHLAEEVDLALSKLRDDYRQAFLLFHEDQLSYIEIAEQLQCPIGTAKTWVHRARRELMQRLKQRHVCEESGYAV